MFRTAQNLIFGSDNPSLYAVDINYAVQTPSGVLYQVLSNRTDGGFTCFSKSTDHGNTWSPSVRVSSVGSCNAVAIWYDRWSNISAGLIHVVYTSGTPDDTFYRTIDTENSDALSTETVIFAGTSASANGCLSVTRAVGGNVLCRTVIDGGPEGGFFKLLNANVPSGAWEAALTDIEALASQDQVILLPDLNSADNQDILAIFWDASADEISRVNYDDSANTWAETSIVTGIGEVFHSASAGKPHFAAAVDLTNSQHVLIAWKGIDALNADLLCWTVDATTITAKTDIVTNSTDDQGLAAIGIDTGTGYWYAFYAGATDGSETLGTDVNVYMKVSTDSGTTWGAETRISTDNYTQNVVWLWCIPRFTNMWCAMMALRDSGATNQYYLYSISPKIQARAQVLLGV